MEHIHHLKRDKKLGKVIDSASIPSISRKKHIHVHLCSSIISQQLSTKVAQVINNRFLDLFDTKTPSPQDILDVPFDKLRSIGLSGSKTNYVRNVCAFFIEEGLTDKILYKMSPDAILSKLVEIKGVGRWTVEMLLMFALGHEDVFAPDDLGIQQAMIRLYGIEAVNNKELKLEMVRISDKWSPYRTYACLYLWAWKDGK